MVPILKKVVQSKTYKQNREENKRPNTLDPGDIAAWSCKHAAYRRTLTFAKQNKKTHIYTLIQTHVWTLMGLRTGTMVARRRSSGASSAETREQKDAEDAPVNHTPDAFFTMLHTNFANFLRQNPTLSHEHVHVERQDGDRNHLAWPLDVVFCEKKIHNTTRTRTK